MIQHLFNFWCRDLYRYRNERSRLQFDFLLLLIAYTGCRPGAIVESRACDSGSSSQTSTTSTTSDMGEEIDKDRVSTHHSQSYSRDLTHN